METVDRHLLTGLDPIVFEDSKVLVLGSMPGETSLAKGQYYAFEANRFWHVIYRLAGTDYSSDYEIKKALLKKLRIALWDSIGKCYRDGSSLDSEIKNVTGNDIAGFLKDHPTIRYVIANGRTSEKYLKKYNPNVEYVYLPSTSPANASVRDVEERWLLTLKRLLKEE